MNVVSTYVWTPATAVRAVMLPLTMSFFLVFLHILVCKSIDGNYCQPAVLPATVIVIAAFFHVFGDPMWHYFVLLCIAAWTALVFHNRGDNKIMQGFIVLFVFSTLAIVLGGLSQGTFLLSGGSGNMFNALGNNGNGNNYNDQATGRQRTCSRYWGTFKRDPSQYPWYQKRATTGRSATSMEFELYFGYCRADYMAFLDLLTILAVLAYLYITVRIIAKFGDLDLAFITKADLSRVSINVKKHGAAGGGGGGGGGGARGAGQGGEGKHEEINNPMANSGANIKPTINSANAKPNSGPGAMEMGQMGSGNPAL